MQEYYYTAVGNLMTKKAENEGKYPVILINGKEHLVDPQEFAVWSILCWRIFDAEELAMKYEELADSLPPARRTLENCVKRLQTRGLVARGMGETDFEALYDLLCDLYVVPVSEKLPLRIAAFIKLVFYNGVSPRKAWQLFRRDHRDEQESRVMALPEQALLTTAELIKCAETGTEDISTDEKLLDALYADAETTSDNIGMLMQTSPSREAVTVAVANLYLRKQIVLERI